MIQRCIQCDSTYPLDQVIYQCASCSAVLEIVAEKALMPHPSMLFRGQGVWRYAPLLPCDPKRAITLGEGATGLHRCDRLARELNITSMYIKNEGENPTGSFKDRGMTVGVTQAVQLGAKTVACASTGNTSASMASYAAKAGLKAVVLVPAGKIAMGKLAQAVIHGAKIVQIEGNFDDAMRLTMELTSNRSAAYLLNSINPFRLEGQKTLAFEVCETLGDAPDTLILPMGNAGNISAIWKGFREFHAAGLITKLPRMIGVQAAGAAPIARYLRGELPSCKVDQPETIASAIRIGAPVSWQKALAAIKDSHGEAALVTDDALLQAQRDLAANEGLFVEPSSAAPIAFLRQHRDNAARGTTVCVTTGHGLKDPDAVLKTMPKLVNCPPTVEALRKALET